MVVSAIVLATGVALSPAPGAGSRWHSPVATHVDRTPRHVRHGHQGRHPVESGRRHAAAHSVGVHRPALHASVGQVRESDWVLVVRPQHRRLLPALAPAQARLLEPGLLLHVTGERVGPWIRVYDSSERSWVNVTNLAPATEPAGWAQTVLKLHPILRPRVTVPPPLPVANVVPATSPGTTAATPQPVVVQQQVVVQPVVQQPAPVVQTQTNGCYTDPATVRAMVMQATDANFGPGYEAAMDAVVVRESGYVPCIVNQSSGAAGIFQALPFSKTGCAISDIACQISWGMGYVRTVYGTPAGALAHEEAVGWY